MWRRKRSAMANIAMLLEESGSALEDIVKIVVYLTGRPIPRPGLSGDGPLAQGRLPRFDRSRGYGASSPGVDRRDRRHCGDPGIASGAGQIMTLSIAGRWPELGSSASPSPRHRRPSRRVARGPARRRGLHAEHHRPASGHGPARPHG